MIRIARPDEPKDLCEARWWRLARAREVHRCGDPFEESAFTGYQTARAALYEAQNRKCAFCEMQLLEAGAPVEHFRPKLRADRIDWSGLAPGAAQSDEEQFARGLPPSDRQLVRWLRTEGYWWLTWNWDNLLVSCPSCNTAYKGNRFPLRRGSEPAGFEGRPIAEEEALLIDPMRIDPQDHIQFSCVNGQWRPAPRRGSPLGAWTIAVLELDHPNHIDFYTDHVDRRHQRRIAELREAARAGVPETITTAWRTLREDAFSPLEPYQALLWDVMDRIIRGEERARLGLDHPRPNAHAAAGTAASELAVPFVDQLAPEARWRMRAVWRRAPAPEAALRDALTAACESGCWTTEELGAMSGRSPQTLAPHLNALCRGGRLFRDAAGRYRATSPPAELPSR